MKVADLAIGEGGKLYVPGHAFEITRTAAEQYHVACTRCGQFAVDTSKPLEHIEQHVREFDDELERGNSR